MSLFSNLVKQVSPVVATVAPFIPGGQAVAAVAAAKTTYDQRERQRALTVEAQNRSNNMEFMGPSRPTYVDTYGSQLIVNKGQAAQPQGFFGTVRSGLQQVGGLVSDAFSSGIPQLLGFNRPQNVGQQPAITTVTNVGAQESQGSGSIQTAGMGALLPSVLGGARSLLKSPLGQVALGGGALLAGSMTGGNGGIRITRKMKTSFRNILNMTGGDLARAADIMGVDQGFYVQVLLKRFRNDGPVVTKAALRKTKQTVRRLKSMCDMYDSLRPTATRRRAPMKRASSTTLIKN